MALTKEFLEAVNSKDKILARIMIKDIMLVDPSLKLFNEMIEYAENNITDLYDEHDYEEFISNSSDWDEDYMNQQMVSVITNFSKERIALLCKIVNKLYDYKIKSESYAGVNNSTATSIEPKNGPAGIQIAGGVAAVTGAGALIGGIIGSSVPIAIVGGVVMVGGIVMVTLGGNKEA